MVKQEPRPDSYAAADLTQADLQAFATYDPATGVFTRNRDGKVLGTPSGSSGRLVIYVNGFLYLAHRLAWLYVYGVWPKGLLDHENRTPSDNRIKNIRPATKGQNAANSDATWSASGYRGVYYQKNTALWRAKLARLSLGYFKTKEAARAAYVAKATELYGEFARVA
jgi:HNH endonuclease/AP2 domain